MTNCGRWPTLGVANFRTFTVSHWFTHVAQMNRFSGGSVVHMNVISYAVKCSEPQCMFGQRSCFGKCVCFNYVSYFEACK
jgi:hypothetical protein